jgi:Tfp pilus assembly protein PilF
MKAVPVGRLLACAGLLVLLGSPALHALPWVPERDDQVLEELPASSDPVARELRGLRRELARDPGNVAQATRLARSYVELGRATSDPRHYGHAEGVLRPWSRLREPPLEVLLLRATIRQNRHDFAAALADLSQVLARDPRSAPAWLTRAVILQVRGELAAARGACLPLLRLADRLTALTCLANVESLSGRAERSYRLLAEALESAAGAPLPERLWSLTSLAEIAVRLGRSEQAERLFRHALALQPRDAYVLAAYADLLLDEDRPEDVVALLDAETRIDSLLLRLALAEQRVGSTELAAHRAILDARFAASRMRGDSLHAGDEARFALHVLGDRREALRLARANWAVQREPRDARVLLETALAAGDPDAARPVLEMLERTSLEDVQLERLAARWGKRR